MNLSARTAIAAASMLAGGDILPRRKVDDGPFAPTSAARAERDPRPLSPESERQIAAARAKRERRAAKVRTALDANTQATSGRAS